MKYKAIFFDRDNTITHPNSEKMDWYHETVRNWSHRELDLDYDSMMTLFDLAGYPKNGLKSLDEEKKFWKHYYTELLKREGVTEDIDNRANLLFQELWCNHDRILFDDVIETMDFFKGQGLKIGVISDTSPSLQLSLEQLGLGRYINSYTCSDLVGAMKPDPIIYNAALESVGVTAEESIYVDDYDVEADGARNLGFTSFHIVRDGEKRDMWGIQSLCEIVDYVKKREKE